MDSKIGMKAFQTVPVTERLPDSVIINPSFTVQEMSPKAPDTRGKRGAAVRIKVTDHYVETTIRATGARIRVYFR